MMYLWIFSALLLLLLPLEVHAASSDDPPCPEGTEAKVVGLQVTCVSTGTSVSPETSQKTGSSSQIDEIQLTDEQLLYLGIGMVIIIIIIAGIAKASQKKSEPESYKDGSNYSYFDREPIPSNLRHQVFQRDMYRCKECGATNKETQLEVDHIKPVSKGGTNESHNLQTLCKKCNRSKYTRWWTGGKTSRI